MHWKDNVSAAQTNLAAALAGDDTEAMEHIADAINNLEAAMDILDATEDDTDDETDD